MAVNTASRDVSEEARDEADSYMKESRIENAEKLWSVFSGSRIFQKASLRPSYTLLTACNVSQGRARIDKDNWLVTIRQPWPLVSFIIE